MARTVVGLFDTFEQANAAVDDLVRSGFSQDEISIVAREDAGVRPSDSDRRVASAEEAFARETSDPVVADAEVGAAAGAILGGGFGLAAGLGGLAIPGIGPVLAAGPLVATLSGLFVGGAAGAAAGGLIGALADAGVPHEHAAIYEEAVRRGGTLVTVTCEDVEARQALEIVQRHGPVDISGQIPLPQEYHTVSEGYTGIAEERPIADSRTREMAGVHHNETPAPSGEPSGMPSEIAEDEAANPDAESGLDTGMTTPRPGGTNYY